MTFVDTSVVMYAVGRPHPLRGPAREFFADAARRRRALCTSAEVLQELVHAYLPVERESTLDSAMALVVRAGIDVWPLEADDVHLARRLRTRFPALAARDLCHLASCRRRGVSDIRTFDRAFAAALRTPTLIPTTDGARFGVPGAAPRPFLPSARGRLRPILRFIATRGVIQAGRRSPGGPPVTCHPR